MMALRYYVHKGTWNEAALDTKQEMHPVWTQGQPVLKATLPQLLRLGEQEQ